jgi:S-adenosylmethionine:tRNA ribosyltransferase-isomerase
VFGAGDYRTRTEDRAPAPLLRVGDRLRFGSLHALITRILAPPRLVRIRFDMPLADFWRGLAEHGKPIQYAHLREPLALWDVWTAVAAMPAAFEPPSAGFILDWRDLASLPARGIRFAALTHAAGLSSTGDRDLDRRLPLDEWYRIPEATANAVRHARSDGARVIAIGTTVVRAVEHAARDNGEVGSGEGVATGRLGPLTKLRVVDAVITGTHERGSSHHDLLRAFASDGALAAAEDALDRHAYRTHEFGDSMFVFRRREHARAANERALPAAA